MQAKATYIDANGTSSPAASHLSEKRNQVRIDIFETANGTKSTRIDGKILVGRSRQMDEGFLSLWRPQNSDWLSSHGSFHQNLAFPAAGRLSTEGK